jgi:hypothetical protein
MIFILLFLFYPCRLFYRLLLFYYTQSAPQLSQNISVSNASSSNAFSSVSNASPPHAQPVATHALLTPPEGSGQRRQYFTDLTDILSINRGVNCIRSRIVLNFVSQIEFDPNPPNPIAGITE